jgi:hypothetical protein
VLAAVVLIELLPLKGAARVPVPVHTLIRSAHA